MVVCFSHVSLPDVGGMLTFIATARFSCTSAHTSCYATLGGGGMLAFIATAMFSCTSAHTSCYATARFSCTSTHTSCYARINEEWQSATKNCHSCGTRSIAPNIRTIHRNSTWLRKKSNYDVQKQHTTLFLFPTNLKFKNHANFSAGSREKKHVRQT